MSRTGLNSSAHLAVTNPGDPRSNESLQWNLSRAGHLARIQHGANSASAWGLILPSKALPICGSETTATNEEAYVDPMIHQVYFEQVNLSTSGAGTAPDKYSLHLSFSLANLVGYTIGNGVSSGTATIGGKVQVELVNSGGSQVLYSAHSTSVDPYGVSSSNILSPTIGTLAKYDVVQTGTISGGLLPSPGQTRDSYIKVTFSDSIYNESISVANVYTLNTFPFTRDYLGVFGYSFKIYNEGS